MDKFINIAGFRLNLDQLVGYYRTVDDTMKKRYDGAEDMAVSEEIDAMDRIVLHFKQGTVLYVNPKQLPNPAEFFKLLDGALKVR